MYQIAQICGLTVKLTTEMFMHKCELSGALLFNISTKYRDEYFTISGNFIIS